MAFISQFFDTKIDFYFGPGLLRGIDQSTSLDRFDLLPIDLSCFLTGANGREARSA